MMPSSSAIVLRKMVGKKNEGTCVCEAVVMVFVG